MTLKDNLRILFGTIRLGFYTTLVYWYPYVISEKSDSEIFLKSSSSCIGPGLSFLIHLKMTANDFEMTFR